MELYHFTATHLLNKITQQGLTLQLLRIIKKQTYQLTRRCFLTGLYPSFFLRFSPIQIL